MQDLPPKGHKSNAGHHNASRKEYMEYEEYIDVLVDLYEVDENENEVDEDENEASEA